MNPLDLYGPQFLLFYGVFGVLVLAALWLRRREAEKGMPIPSGLSDPYLIAYLRGGRQEAVNVAVLALIDAGLLRLENERLTANGPEAPSRARRPLDRAILAHFQTSGTERGLLGDAGVRAALSEYEASLRSMGALPGPETMRTRVLFYLAALALLLGLALAKIVVALARGRHNVWFLVILAVGFVVGASLVAFPRRTSRGDALLADLRTLFTPLRHRVGQLKHGLEANEFAFLAAAFGVPLLPSGPEFSAFRVFRRRQSQSGSCSFSGGCGGASCGSSCGSGCGGGSCGGGCGGCGERVG